MVNNPKQKSVYIFTIINYLTIVDIHILSTHYTNRVIYRNCFDYFLQYLFNWHLILSKNMLKIN